ncbi:MAG: nucleotidyltransferase domain-containing protein [Bacilli bacterium]|nr:nucleotidyltransferase domain-containing protein [Bacilli bacterium]
MENPIAVLRKNLGLSQSECCKYLGIPKTTLCNYEQGIRKPTSWAFDLILEKLSEYESFLKAEYSTKTGIYPLSLVRRKITEVLCKHPEVSYCLLFGSYAKGKAKENSDVDLYIQSDVTGFAYFGLLEELKEKLNKEIDLMSPKNVEADGKIDQEMKKTGILIYERK